MVTINVCSESGLRSNLWCRKRECAVFKEFEEGTQPIKKCDLHTKPQKALKEAHYSGLGLLLWFMHRSWRPRNLVKYTGFLNRTVERIRREKFSAIDFFVSICDGRRENWYANKKLPWKRKLGKIYFDEWNPKWWERIEIFIQILKRWEIEPSLLLFSRYLYWAFKHANGRPIDFYSKEGLEIQIALTRKLIILIQKYFGKDFMPWLKANNELNCRNNNKRGVVFAEWYVALFDGIQDLFPEKDDVSKWVLNTDDCEWIVIPFAYDETFEFRGYYLGQGRFLRNGHRKYVDEIHMISCPENVEDGRVDMALKARFPKRTPQRDHEDCGCGRDEDKNPIGKGAGFYPFFVGNNEQTFEAQKLLHSKYKAKGRSTISVYLNLDCLRKRPILRTKGVYMEFCKEEELDWIRPKAFIDGIKAGLGIQ